MAMNLYKFILAGLVGASAVALIGFLISRGKAARLEGTITNVRTLGMDENMSVAIVDFEAANPSQILMVISDRDVSIVDRNGLKREGSTISAGDLKGLFGYFPALGPMENQPVIDRVKVGPGESLQGMVGARFGIPKHELDARQELTLTIEDVDGGVSELRLRSEPPEASPQPE